MDHKEPSHSKSSWRWLYWLGGAIAVLVLLYFVVVKPIVKNKILDAIQRELAGGGPTHCSGLGYSLWGNQLWVEGLDFTRNAEDGPATCRAQFGDIEVRGIGWWNLVVNKKILLDKLHIKTPRIKMIGQPFSSSASDTSSQEKMYFNIGEILIEGGHLTYFEAEDTSRPVAALDTFRISIENVQPDTSQDGNSFQFQQIRVSSQQCSFLNSNNLYRLQTGTIAADSRSQSVSVRDLSWMPTLEKNAFAKKVGHQKVRMEVSVPEINIQQINLVDLILKKNFQAGNIMVDGLKMDTYKNKNLPENTAPKLLPHQALAEAKPLISIDTIQLKNAYISYSELGPKSDKAGTIFFDDLYASLYNIHNKDKSKKIAVDTKAKFMGSGDLNVHFDLNPSSADYAYSYQGKLGTFQMADANSMLDPRMGVVIKSGQIEELSFDVKADRQSSSGKCIFIYTNLDAQVQDKKTDEKKGLFTLAANLLTKKENTRDGGEFRKGKIYFERVPNKAIFNDMWQSVFSGIKSTVMSDLMLPDKLDSKEKEISD